MYIGNDLQIAHPSYKIIDDISSSFNGSTTSFALQVNGQAPVPFPISTQQVMISVNGVVQEPDPSGSAGFKLLGSNIVFSSAPANGHAFFGVINAGADYVTAGSEFPDGSATAPSFTFQDDQDTGWFRSGSGAVGYSANGVQTLTFDGNGLTIAANKGLTVDTNTLHIDATNNRVGIGTTSPNSKFQVNDTNPVIAEFYHSDGGDDDEARIALGAYSSNPPSQRGVTLVAKNNSAGHDFIINTSSSHSAGPTEKMRIDSSGKVGINQTPTRELSLHSPNNNNALIHFTNDDTGETASDGILVGLDGNENMIINNQETGKTINIFNGGSERMRIDSSGRLLIGATTNVHNLTDKVQISSTDSTASIYLNRYANNAFAAYLHFNKSRSGTIGGNTIVQDGDLLGRIYFEGNDGNSPQAAAYIEAHVDGTPGATDMPGRLEFLTTADSAATPTERMRITSAGKIGINEDDPDGDLQVTSAGSADAQLKVGGSESTGNGMKITYSNSGNTSTIFKQNYHATNAGALMQFDSGLFYFRTGTSPTTALTLDSSQNASFAGTVSDSKGNLRSIPLNTQSGSGNYNLVAADAGKTILASGNVTIADSIFSGGDAVTIINNTNGDITINKGSVLYYTADGTSANRTLATRGMATIYFTHHTTGYISGAGLS